MSSENPLDEVMKGQPLAVDIASIEDQLRELWKDAVSEDNADEDSEKPVARTSVLNLVVYVEEADEGGRVTEAISELTAENPCRAIVVIAEPGKADARIDAWISAHCRRPSPTSKVVCCEQISLQAAGSAVRELAPTVVPLLISDLPVFLWWDADRLFESDFLKSMTGVCERLILDSRHWTSPPSDFPRLQSYIESQRDRLAVSDLAWHRLRQWRELTAQFFDAPVFRTHLEHIDNVVVEFNCRAEEGSSIPPQAYLLVGWLASRLQWSVNEAEWVDGGQQFRLQTKEGRPVKVTIQSTQAHEDLCGHLVSFEISTAAEWATSFRIAKGENVHIAQTEIAFANMPPYRRFVPLRIYNEVELVARQLEIFGHDPIYEESISMASQLLGALRGTP